MSIALTSWKEIAAYVGKGVRTVQRWEREIGFPVRRPNHGNGRVFAIPEELDAWILSRPARGSAESKAKLTRLVSKVAELEQENATLRHELTTLTDGLLQSRKYRDTAPVELSDRCLRLVQASTFCRLDCAEAIDVGRNIRATRSVNRRDRPRFQTQIAVMLSWCAIAEVDLLHGRIEEARRFVGKIRHICEEIQSWLNENQFADARMTPAREHLSHLQARILSIESRFVT